jgi:hypothetical protein
MGGFLAHPKKIPGAPLRTRQTAGARATLRQAHQPGKQFMAKSRKELQTLLDTLDERVPSMIRANPCDVQFWNAFWRASDFIIEEAGAFDYDWLLIRLDCILERHGKVSSEDLVSGSGSQSIQISR